MRYQGGKHLLARHLVEAIRGVVGPGAKSWWEPFCGGLSMSVALTKEFGPGVVSDDNRALVVMYQHVLAGWVPPEALSEAEYAAARLLPDENPLKAFAGIGCSFGGKWFGGYARDHIPRRSYPIRFSSRAIRRDVPIVGRVHWADFLAIEPAASEIDFLYLDPPYQGVCQYAATGAFDHDAFQQRVKQWADLGHDVFISEYAFPIGDCIWRKERKSILSLSGRGAPAIEKLFYLPRRVLP